MRPDSIQILYPYGTGDVEGLGTNIGKKKKSFSRFEIEIKFKEVWWILNKKIFPTAEHDGDDLFKLTCSNRFMTVG